MSTIQSFAPQSGDHPRVLVLGSIPGVASLEAVQYYAHPRNAFWPIMADYFGFSAQQPYKQRLQQLLAQDVALWDVLGQCQRAGSLDSAIVRDSMVVNPIDQWLHTQPQLQAILLNGSKAMQVFRKHFPRLVADPELTVLSMPSTSPAYAAMNAAKKKQRWHAALGLVFEHQ